jgi:peptide deformylase
MEQDSPAASLSMRILMKIVNYPHPSLRHPGVPVKAIDNRVRSYVQEMLALMYEGKGLGLAAPQVGLPLQIFVMNLKADPAERDTERAYINPQIIERRGSVEGEEGCLSFPGLYGKVRRARSIRFQAYNISGELLDLSVSELEARVVQHEVDHLHGELFIDKMGSIAKMASRGSIKQFERDYRRAQERGEIPPDAIIEKLLTALEAQAGGSTDREPPVM